MARKNSQARPGISGINIQFVDMRLSGEHKEGFREWFQRKGDMVALDIATFISNGHKIGITWDDKHTCWIVSATCKDDANVNVDCCVTSRSDEWYEALAMCVYKNDVVANKGRWLDESNEDHWG